MSGRLVVLLATVAALALVSGLPPAHAGAGSPVAASGGGYRLVSPTVDRGATVDTPDSPLTALGGGYRLVSASAGSAASAAGGGYRLQAAAPSGRGSPCCCIYLPCLLRP